MASVDPKDSTSVDMPVPDYEATLESGVKGLRVGIPKEYRIDGAPPEIDALWAKGAEWLKAQGAEIVEVSPAAHQIRAARLLYSRACGGVVEPRAL